MNNRVILFCLSFLLFFSSTTFAGIQIQDYHPTFIPGYDAHGNLRIATRMFYRNHEPYFLIVNPNTFSTSITPITSFKSRRLEPSSFNHSPGNYTMQELQATPYYQALLTYSAAPYKTSHYGINHAKSFKDGVFLTVDMCPSKNPFEKELFDSLIKKANREHRPIPVGISMTGLWLLSHPTEFNWLLEQQKNKKLSITWINHSFAHIDYTDLPDDQNFLLAIQTNLDQEILAEEKLLLEHGQIPSVFFRLPGLASNEKIILRLKEFGLIPLDTNALMGSKRNPVELPLKSGSIILVHGNGNAHKGVELFLPILKQPMNFLPVNEVLTSN